MHYPACCRPIPGDPIVGYLGRGEGLVVHTVTCPIASKLQHKDSERFIAVDWADDPVRAFETEIVVAVVNGTGVLARVAGALADAETDITHIDMGQEPAHDATDLRFVVAVRCVRHCLHLGRERLWLTSADILWVTCGEARLTCGAAR